MKTILVPVDFTATSENAVNFAVEWGIRYGYEHIILYKAFYESTLEYITVGAGAFVEQGFLERQRKAAKRQLKVMREQLLEKAGGALKVTTIVNELPLLRGIFNILNSDDDPELIVLGSDRHTDSYGSFVSNNIISIARASPVKTLIVPYASHYQPVKHILIPCNNGSFSNFSKLERFKLKLKEEQADLMILNVHAKDLVDAEDLERKQWEDNIDTFLGDIPHSIYHAVDRNVINGIMTFTSSHEVDLIIALPGRHSFLYYLANKSISEGIYKNTRQTVLILK